MALGLTEEHLELAAAVRGWAQRNCPAEGSGPAADGPDGGSERYLASLRPGLAGQGLLGLHLPEEYGGQGYGLPELAVALEELGRALVPGGYLPTVLAGAVLAAAGGMVAGKLQAGLADGTAAGAVSLAPGLTGRAGPDGGLIVDGEAAPVLGASLADLVIAGVQTEHGEIWVAVDTAGLQVTSWTAWTSPGRLPGSALTAAASRRPAAHRPGPRRGDQPGRDPVRRRGGRHGRLGHQDRR